MHFLDWKCMNFVRKGPINNFTHWFGQWLGTEQATSHYRSVNWRISQPQWVNPRPNLRQAISVKGFPAESHLTPHMRVEASQHISISHHRQIDSLLNRLFTIKNKKTPKPDISGPCEGSLSITNGFSSQGAKNAESLATSWHHHFAAAVAAAVVVVAVVVVVVVFLTGVARFQWGPWCSCFNLGNAED